MAFDFERGNGEMRGFFSVDTSSVNANFVSGDYYWISKYGIKADGITEPSLFERAQVGTVVLITSQRTLDAIELLYYSNITRTAGTKSVVYVCGVDPGSMAKIINYTSAGVVKYLGPIWSLAKKEFADDITWGKMWPKGFMDHVISGWERDAQ